MVTSPPTHAIGLDPPHHRTPIPIQKAFPKELNLMGSEAEYQRSDEDVLRELPFKLAPRVTKAGA